MSTPEELNRAPTEEDLNRLQATTLQYYLHESNPANGLVRDKTDPAAPASIAAVGLALTTIRCSSNAACSPASSPPRSRFERLRFFRDSPQGREPDATGYRGFYYHFLDMKTGRRVWECELSTIDSAFLFAGMLTCAAYFDAETEEEAEVRRLADELYRRADWQWALNGGVAVSHGWRPETGFIPHRWTGYDEALLVYLLGLGSPTFPLPAESYAAYRSTYQWKRDLRRASCSTRGRCSRISSRTSGSISAASVTPSCANTAATISRTVARRPTSTRSTRGATRSSSPATANTAGASLRPTDPVSRPGRVNGIERKFYGYQARGAPYGPDDGTLAPWVVVASLPFAPEIVIPTVRAMAQLDLGATKRYGFKPSFNATYAVPDSPTGWWVTPYHFGIDQRPGHPHDRELSHRPDLGDHAPLPLRDGGIAPGGLPGRLALKAKRGNSMTGRIRTRALVHRQKRTRADEPPTTPASAATRAHRDRPTLRTGCA